MNLRKSPGGSVFPYYYKGGEIHALKYGSFYSAEDALFALMKAEEDFIIIPNRRLRIWVDFYKTVLSDRVLDEFLANLSHLNDNIIKLAIVGCSFRKRFRLLQKKKKSVIEYSFPIKFFSDPEDAKTWLVRE